MKRRSTWINVTINLSKARPERRINVARAINVKVPTFLPYDPEG